MKISSIEIKSHRLLKDVRQTIEDSIRQDHNVTLELLERGKDVKA